MNRNAIAAISGVAAAVVITTTMDATGYSLFSALPLFPLAAIFWYGQGFSRREVGLTWGTLHGYGLAVGYPLLVLGAMSVIAYLGGAIDSSDADWNKTIMNIMLMSSSGIIMILITEEGFFRGWLWAALRRARQTQSQTLLWTTLAFSAWHVSAVTLETGFDLPAREIPVYLVNVTLIGAVFGLLRLASGSVVVAAVAHSLWNGFDYPLFGFGENAGALGIEQTMIYGPEVGWLGIVCNAAFLAGLWVIVRRRQASVSMKPA